MKKICLSLLFLTNFSLSSEIDKCCSNTFKLLAFTKKSRLCLKLESIFDQAQKSAENKSVQELNLTYEATQLAVKEFKTEDILNMLELLFDFNSYSSIVMYGNIISIVNLLGKSLNLTLEEREEEIRKVILKFAHIIKTAYE